MKTFLTLGLLSFSLSGLAQINLMGDLKSDDQKYYRNDSNDGNNNRERTDSLVKEVNRLNGDIATLKNEVRELKSEIEQLKQKR